MAEKKQYLLVARFGNDVPLAIFDEEEQCLEKAFSLDLKAVRNFAPGVDPSAGLDLYALVMFTLVGGVVSGEVKVLREGPAAESAFPAAREGGPKKSQVQWAKQVVYKCLQSA